MSLSRSIMGLITMAAAVLLAQSPDQTRAKEASLVGRPAFAVASVKASAPWLGPTRDRIFLFTSAGQLRANGIHLAALISHAYGIQDFQISGGPQWLYSDQYDIVAEAETKATRDQLMQMLQALLEDRFKLTMHHQIKELPIYALTVGENGAKLVRASDGPLQPKPTGDRLTVMRMDMRDFAVWLSRQTGGTVVDFTGLTGRYDIRLDWNRNELSGTSDPSDASLFAAIEEQLGLRLAPRKQGVDVLIIDGAERPGEN